MTGHPLELFTKFFGAVRAIFRLWGSFSVPDKDVFGLPRSLLSSMAKGPRNLKSGWIQEGLKADTCLERFDSDFGVHPAVTLTFGL